MIQCDQGKEPINMTNRATLQNPSYSLLARISSAGYFKLQRKLCIIRATLPKNIRESGNGKGESDTNINEVAAEGYGEGLNRSYTGFRREKHPAGGPRSDGSDCGLGAGRLEKVAKLASDRLPEGKAPHRKPQERRWQRPTTYGSACFVLRSAPSDNERARHGRALTL